MYPRAVSIAWWGVVLELTNGKPQLRAGDLICDDHRLNTPRGGFLHCAREDYGRESATLADGYARNGRLYCDNFAVFPYLDDVFPGGTLARCLLCAQRGCPRFVSSWMH